MCRASRDKGNKMEVERGYRGHCLVWEPGPNGSGIDPKLVQEWVRCSHTSCTSMHWSWSGAEAEWRQKRQSGGRQGWRRLEVGGEGEGRSVMIRNTYWSLPDLFPMALV